MTYTPESLELWTLPDSYAGAEWPDYYVFLGQHRDSDELGQSNFACGLEAIGGESETVMVIHEGHWAVGWVEWIAIHKSDSKALKAADEIMAALSDYPVFNEDDFSEREYEAANETWDCQGLAYRVEMCARAGISIFAARHDCVPSDDTGMLRDLLLGH